MKNLIYVFTFLACAAIFSCAAVQADGFRIKGQITDAPNVKVYLDQKGGNNQTLVLAQVETDAEGNFAIAMDESPSAGVYRLRVGAQNALLVLDGSENAIEVSGEMASLKKYAFELKGSASANDFKKAIRQLRSGKMPVEKVSEYIEGTKYPLAAMQLAMSTFGNRSDFWEMHKKAATRVSEKYPDSEEAKQYNNFVKQLEAQHMSKMAREKIKVGEPAPDIALTSPEGDKYQLSELKGKVVLVDFWASWCGPCRKANPHVVSVYDKYVDQGFTVFSVSLDGLDRRTKARLKSEEAIQQNLDRSKDRWVAAIEKDNLKWDYHVSELAKWDTKAAKQYGVSGIPKTFLIDRDGKIAAINPRYNLEEALLKVL